MIQRIQSLLLLGVAILLITNLFVPIWTETQSGSTLVLNAFSIHLKDMDSKAAITTSSTPVGVYYIGSLISACIVLTLFIIFKYNNRALQIKLCNLLTLLTLGVIGTYFIAIPAAKALLIQQSVGGDYEIGYFLPILANLLIVAAKYYIKKDEELVRSVDRLR